jgi:hypothetical protein
METLICYSKEIRKVKQSSWRSYCQEINDVLGSSRLMRIMAKQATNMVRALLSYVTVSLPKWEKIH